MTTPPLPPPAYSVGSAASGDVSQALLRRTGIARQVPIIVTDTYVHVVWVDADPDESAADAAESWVEDHYDLPELLPQDAHDAWRDVEYDPLNRLLLEPMIGPYLPDNCWNRDEERRLAQRRQMVAPANAALAQQRVVRAASQADRQPHPDVMGPTAPLPPPAYSVGSGDLRDGPQPVCSVCERPWPTGYDNCPSRNQSWHQNRATMRAHPFALVPDTDHCADCGRGRFAYCHQPEPSYLCNCGESFREHLARVAHMATCPTMQEGPR